MMGQAQEIYGSVPDPRLHKRLAQRLYDVCPQVRHSKVETKLQKLKKSFNSFSRGEHGLFSPSQRLTAILTHVYI